MKTPTTDEQIAEVQRRADEEIGRIKAAAERKARQIEERARANEEARKRADALRTRLEYEHDVPKAKRDLVWSKAWEHGHYNGDSDIEFWYGEFAEVAR